jgi:DNA-directed RNA polymerase sigma subunit (sigma70/sigma32)
MEPTALEKIEKLGKALAGMTQAELARAVGVSRERIRQLLPRMKLKPGRRVRAWHRTVARKTCEAMAKLHDEGLSLSAIGRKFSVSDYHVREAIRQVRPTIEPAGRIQRQVRQEQIRQLLAKGLTFEQACEKLEFSGLQRRRYRRQMGFAWKGSRTVTDTRKKRGR